MFDRVPHGMHRDLLILRNFTVVHQFHCRELSASEVECVGTPDVMAMEIEAARSMRASIIGHFFWYPEREPETQMLIKPWELC